MGELWELFEVDLRLKSGGVTLEKNEGRCLGRELYEGLGKLRWIVVKIAGVTQGSVMV